MINRDFLNRMDAGMMPLRVGISFLCLFVAVMISVTHNVTSFSLPHYGEGVFLYILLKNKTILAYFYRVSVVFYAHRIRFR